MSLEAYSGKGGLKLPPPHWINEIYGFQGVLKSPCVLTAPPYITKSWLNFTFSLPVRLAVVLNT